MSKKEILLVGKVPSPIGGVTIHVSRLKDHLEKSSIKFSFIELIVSNWFQIIRSLFKYNVVHLHTSNVWVRLVFSCLSLILNFQLILTFHGNLGRHKSFLNLIDKVSIKFSTVPVVLNQSSFEKANRLNKNTRLISAFLPPNKQDLTNLTIVDNVISELIGKFSKVYCTNAFDVAFDKDGNEIYGISSLVNLFNSIEDAGLIVSDPSGNYRKYLESNKVINNENIKIIDVSHSFFYVLQNTDGFIRSTTTDGDSLSIKEALYLGKTVYCTDCVDRPSGVILFKTQDYSHLERLLSKERQSNEVNHNINMVSGYDKLEKLYLELI